MDPSSSPGPFLGGSGAVARVLELVERAARTDVPVLLTGETGTGKSHLARLLHARSVRRDGRFVGVNCAGIPDGLFESEFFGHKRGAFTGAVESRTGLFEEATGGTLFLDEVGELPSGQQAKLLTALEERRVRPVGASRARPVDVRVVAATARDLVAEVGAGSFRSDLYHRIALLRLELPPLRTRPDDTRVLALHVLGELARKYGRPGLSLSDACWRLILSHAWPGNVRELAHVLEAAVIVSGARGLRPEHLLPWLQGSPDGSGPSRPAPVETPSNDGVPEARRYSFFGSEEEEREAIRGALVRCRGNRTRAARELGMARNTLRERLRRYEIE